MSGVKAHDNNCVAQDFEVVRETAKLLQECLYCICKILQEHKEKSIDLKEDNANQWRKSTKKPKTTEVVSKGDQIP
ncbi:hypothetical protein RSOLAG1IB_11675 [Rhizoctonia solani AG-1 IB]|uniref:Uncharacterized protein n=1 Tax=Thanatephorus cucumeris (strain AG1-IB / isolate 7/3/14) TaxID=1108050 RepID=M5CEL2_THACB|nr:hypothetical protein BN14_08475 [Rhizoctonia solani AG-1 IB]CEL54428.1 hypothetical protein RSOLAG1IB_11675 [Rhizoctonia solani AG-1 IB]